MIEVLARLRQQRLTDLCQRHLARGPHQKLQPQILFDLPDSMAQRRLRKVELRCRAAKAAQLGNGDEGLEPQIVDAHVWSPCRPPDHRGACLRDKAR